MRSLAAKELLSLWERAASRGVHERALDLLEAALPDVDQQVRAHLDLGTRDWHLLRLRTALFGGKLPCYGDCPHCGERLEIELDARPYAAAQLQDARELVDARPERWRLPNTHDLIAAASPAAPDDAARVLFER